MDEFEWNDAAFCESDEENELTTVNPRKVKSRTRKWREIELLKERKRLAKEMLMYDEYGY